MYDRVKMSNISVILTRPKYSGNIGSAARCVKNMGIDELIVVNPGEVDEGEMNKMATHLARDIVAGIQFFDGLRDAVAPFQYVVGTTGRAGSSSLRRSMVSSATVAEELMELSQNNRIALVFGPEDTGLSNEDLQYCNLLVKIPTSDKLRSINLSHAVMIVCYELFSARRTPQKNFTPRLASSAEVEAMLDDLKEMLVKIDFIGAANPNYSMINVRKFFTRTKLLAKDVKIIRGICRQVDLHGRGKTTGLTKKQKT